jgi:hypothetical protein
MSRTTRRSGTARVWAALDDEHRVLVVATLARLIAPIPTIASSHAAWKPNGNDACNRFRLRKPTWRAASESDLDCCTPTSVEPFSCWDAISGVCVGTDDDRSRSQRAVANTPGEVIIAIDKDTQQAHLTLRWRGGLLSELDIALWGVHTPAIRTDEDTIDLLRRLAVHYPDAVIVGIFNRQGRRTATGLRFTVKRPA